MNFQGLYKKTLKNRSLKQERGLSVARTRKQGIQELPSLMTHDLMQTENMKSKHHHES